MICVYRQDAVDFTGTGLGVLHPISAEVTGRVLGEYAVDISCAVDEAGEWRLLEPERIVTVRCPEEHPDLAAVRAAGTELPLLEAIGEAAPVTLGGLTIRMARRVLALEASPTAQGWLVATRQGDVGYVAADAVTQSRTDTVTGFGVARGSRQPFRIMSVERTTGGVNAYARHLWYDATGCVVSSMVGEGRTYQQAVSALGDTLLGGVLPAAHGAPTKAGDTHDFKFEGKNATEIILGGGGLMELWGSQLYRSWYDWWAYNDPDTMPAPVLRSAQLLTELSGEDDDSDVYTHIVPMGADANGKKLFLPEVAIVSEYADLYPRPMYKVISVGEAKVSKDMTKAQAIKKLRAAAREELAAGCDLPVQTFKLGAPTIRDERLENVRPGSAVTVIAPRLGVRRTLPCSEYRYDAVLGVYTELTLGDPPATLASAAMDERRARLITEGVISGGGEPTEETTTTSACTGTHNSVNSGNWLSIGSANNAIIGVDGGSNYSARFAFSALSGSPGSVTVRVPRSMSSGAGEWRVHVTNDSGAHGTGSNLVYALPVSKGTGDVSIDLTDQIAQIRGYSGAWYVIITCYAGLYWAPGGANAKIDVGVYS